MRASKIEISSSHSHELDPAWSQVTLGYLEDQLQKMLMPPTTCRSFKPIAHWGVGQVPRLRRKLSQDGIKRTRWSRTMTHSRKSCS